MQRLVVALRELAAHARFVCSGGLAEALPHRVEVAVLDFQEALEELLLLGPSQVAPARGPPGDAEWWGA